MLNVCLKVVALLVLAIQFSNVQGTIVDDLNRPVAKAVVELRDVGLPQPLYSVTTDGEGRFAVPQLQPKKYTIIAARPGYVRAEYDAAASATSSDLRLTMVRTASISGRVTDTLRQPLVRMTVEVLKATYDAGRPVFTVVQSTHSNDLGEYRIFWLPPGRYFLAVNPSGGTGNIVAGSQPAPIAGGVVTATPDDPIAPEAASRFGLKNTSSEIYAPVYFPGTVNEEQATPIDIAPGQELQSTDFIISRVKVYKITGYIAEADGRTPTQKSRMSHSRIPSAVQYTDNTEATTGKFELSVVPGRYSLLGYTETAHGSIEVEVRDRDLDSVVIPIKPGYNLSGKILIEGSASVIDTSSFRVQLRPVPDFAGSFLIVGTPAADGSFSLSSVQPGNYRVALEPFEKTPSQGRQQRGAELPGATVANGLIGTRQPLSNNPSRVLSALPKLPPTLANAYFKSVRLGNTDLAGGELQFDIATLERLAAQPQSLDILIGLDGGTVQGKTLNHPNATVVLVPDAPSLSRYDLYKTAKSDEAGDFQIAGIAPGSYTIYAWMSVEDTAWLNPEFMRLFQGRGAHISVNGGTRVSMNLAVMP